VARRGSRGTAWRVGEGRTRSWPRRVRRPARSARRAGPSRRRPRRGRRHGSARCPAGPGRTRRGSVWRSAVPEARWTSRYRVRDEGVYAAHALRAVTEITAGSRNGLFTSWAASYRFSVQLSDRETQFECAGGHGTVRQQGWGDSAFRLPKGNTCLRTSGSTCPSTPRSATHTPRAKQRISDPGVALRLTGRECFLINTAEAAMQVLALRQECRHRSSRAPRGRS
jgi:hypothetical protein